MARLAVRDAERLTIEVSWDTGEEAISTDAADLDGIADIEHLSSLRIFSHFEDKSMLFTNLIGFSAGVRGEGGAAADRGRQIVTRWARLPRERRRELVTYTLITMFLVVVTLGCAVAWVVRTQPNDWLSLTGYIAICILGLGVAYAPFSRLGKIGTRARVLITRERWWRDLRIVVPILVGVAGVIVNIVALALR